MHTWQVGLIEGNPEPWEFEYFIMGHGIIQAFFFFPGADMIFIILDSKDACALPRREILSFKLITYQHS